MRTPDQLNCLLRNLYARQEATLRTTHGKTDWFKTGKGQSLFQTPRRVVLKNVQTIGQLHSSPMLVRLRSKSFKLGFSIMWIENFLMSKLHLEKAEEPESKLPTFTESQRKQGNSRKTSTSVSSTTLKCLPVWIIINCGKFLKRWEYPSPEKLVLGSRNKS